MGADRTDPVARAIGEPARTEPPEGRQDYVTVSSIEETLALDSFSPLPMPDKSN